MSRINTQKTLSRSAFALAAALSLAVVPIAAQAAATTVEVSARSYGEKVTFTYVMDEMDTDEAAAEMYKAMARKADVACKKDIPRSLGRTVNKKRCTKQILNGFVKDLDNDRISGLHKAS
ncbi:hypothetical protein GCM10007853_05510 [Algimonas ampicilliniresistens]|jgi:hypothetical protein|uniref:UrcA family protein n=1 Tax=Algimonas ampicilliniresistens TaxID=1298735 RepID=A0ABQ5V6H8_9PROT|nr:hypothetical protein [Algimonas ampicilliniresistens]GLQ22677.1 hypothetical protein GCM10007853_05510 [Algimonas ampicilliniresistens]